MDRLSIVIACVLAASGCEDRKPGTAEPPSRVNGAPSTARQGATTSAFCDVHFTGDTGTALEWPALADGASRPGPTTGWRWINVWATWCKPCIEEMPRLLAWRTKLAAKGQRLDLVFLSMDETADDVTAYRKLHPGVPASLRLADPAAAVAWFRDLGLTGDPPIPIHVIVSPAGRVRCTRAGGVREQDFAVVEKLLAE